MFIDFSINKVKVLQLTKHYPPYFGGIESVTYDITEGLKRQGIEVDVLCANDSFRTQISSESYIIERVASLGKVFSTSIAPALVSALKRKSSKYDIIHVHFPDPLAALALFLVRPKSKIIIHWHSDVIKQKLVLRAFRPLQNWILDRADLIIGTTKNYIDHSPQLRIFRDKCVAIPIGINPCNLTFQQKRINEIKETYLNKRIVFSLGRLIYYKGFEYLVDAAGKLDDNTVVLIGGSGELFESLRLRIERQGLSEKVILVGRIPQNDLGNFFQACDIFCLPSIERSEAFGVVQLEALSFGKPIISTEIEGSGVSWVNKHGVTGFSVPIKDSDALASKIKLLLNDNITYTRFSKAAIERFNFLFTSEKMVDQIIHEYNKLLY